MKHISLNQKILLIQIGIILGTLLLFYAVGLLSRVLYKKKEEEENSVEENSMNDET